ncbi:hypothetical protein [Domibacillus epiphyticus]|uniref:hypothetical protein n=1 Tax=Domibacillus epiphyticus TaxID=1714355 RepID=UPI001300F42C|nr:hypothetical protein [Domibacillus epiphyticus]
MLNQANEDAGQKIQDTVDVLMKKGVPPRTAAFAASMGYLRAFRKKGNSRSHFK